jgi:hypothetical protein
MTMILDDLLFLQAFKQKELLLDFRVADRRPYEQRSCTLASYQSNYVSKNCIHSTATCALRP